MKTKIYFLSILCAVLLLSAQVNAQCGSRYTDIASFPNVSDTTVIYDVYDSAMDIYLPVGDTSATRPLIVLAHGGTFYEGNKTDDPPIVQLCQNFAKRGYVTASINYRLLTEDQLVYDAGVGDTAAIIAEVIQALSDGKAAIRYFSKDAATANTYRIDTNRMFIGGNSAGAVLAMHYAYLTNIDQAPAYLQTIITANGGIEGNSGNAGYTSRVAGVISLAGGLNNPDWIIPGGIPSYNAQGTDDSVVPYYCADAVNGSIGLRLCGLGSLEPVYDSNQITHSSLLFPGEGHVPWEDLNSMFTSLDSSLNLFMASTLCQIATGVNTVIPAADINLFPNPASDVVYIRSSQLLNTIQVYDETGRQVMEVNHVNEVNYQLNTAILSKGVYMVRFTAGQNPLPIVRKVVIE